MNTPTPPLSLRFDLGTLLLQGGTPPGQKGSGGVWKWDPRVSAWRTDALHYADVIRQFAASGIAIVDEVPAWSPVQWPRLSLHQPRPHQLEATRAWEVVRRGIVTIPTGGGKTDLALALMATLGISTLIVAPVRDLMYQWHRRIQEGLGYDAGILGDNQHNVRPITVTTYDSACIHMDSLGNRFQLVVFDECHHLPGPTRGDAARMCAAPYRLGLTATLPTQVERRARVEELIGPVCYSMPLSRAKGTILADYEVVRIPVYLNDAERAEYNRLGAVVSEHMSARVREDPGFQWNHLYHKESRDPGARRAIAAHRKRKSIEDRAVEKLRVVEDIFRLHPRVPTIIFVGTNVMAREVSLRFLIPCLLQHCGKRERNEIFSGFAGGRYPAIVANQVLDEGVDLPEAKVAIVLGGMASPRQAVQRLGRVLRRSSDERAVLYEVVCGDTGEETKSRKRRNTDAYAGTRHRRH